MTWRFEERSRKPRNSWGNPSRRPRAPLHLRKDRRTIRDREHAPGDTIVFDEEELWVRWEDVAGLELRPVVDLQSVAARGIARLSGAEATADGWLMSPDYQVVRRLNRFDEEELLKCQPAQ